MRLSQALCSCHFKQQGCGLGLASVSTSASTSAPPCLSEHCIPVSSADTGRHLRSANRHLLAVPRFRLNTYGRRAFSVAGPMAWNSLPVFIRDLTSSTDCLGVYLKRTCSRVTSASSALGVLDDYALYKSTHSLTHSLVSALPRLEGFVHITFRQRQLADIGEGARFRKSK